MRYQQDNYLFIVRPDGSLRYCRSAEWRQIRDRTLTLERFPHSVTASHDLLVLQVSMPVADKSPGLDSSTRRDLRVEQFSLAIDAQGRLAREVRAGKRTVYVTATGFANWCRQLAGGQQLQCLSVRHALSADEQSHQVLADYIGGLLGDCQATHAAALEPERGRFAGKAGRSSLVRRVPVGAEKWQQADAFAQPTAVATRACA